MSSMDPTFRSKFFTNEFTISVPSYPSIKFFRATPSHIDIWLPMMSNPQNTEFQDSKFKIWDSAAVEEWTSLEQQRYEEARSTFSPLHLFISVDNSVVGYGGIFEIIPGFGNIGIVLNPEARSKGVGKLAVSVFAQLAFEFGLEVVAGTMKANVPMQKVFRGLGFQEREEIEEIPGRGIVAELRYKLARETWKDIDMKVEFTEPIA